jgi:hypothetical protein
MGIAFKGAIENKAFDRYSKTQIKSRHEDNNK